MSSDRLKYGLLTEYGKNIDKAMPLKEYPRPQLKRNSYICLNGEWDFESKSIGKARVLVPFPLESCLSGIKDFKHIKGEFLCYKRNFMLDKDFIKDITLLHIGAVEQSCEIYINGKFCAAGENGYLPLCVDISQHIFCGANSIEIKVKDDLDYSLPTGKQRKKRGGIWYTAVSGIWQSVWLESVNKGYIKDIKFTPDVQGSEINIELISDTEEESEIVILFNNEVVSRVVTDKSKVTVKLDKAKLWSPDTPDLYYVTVNRKGDSVNSYFAMREIKIEEGRFVLNGEPVFLNGLLDQGYFSDGIYTPASYLQYKDDIETAKAMGFNCLRKHIKIEPMIFYHYCDTLGMIVLQDMVNVGKYSFFKDTVLPFSGKRKGVPYISVNKKQRENFICHSKNTVDYLYSCPSVLYYTIFNEGWGQFDGDLLYTILKKRDKSRIYDATSGWFRQKLSDVQSEHVYFRPIVLKKNDERPVIVSEFGGYSISIKGHCFNTGKQFGYKKYCDIQSFENDFIKLYKDEIIGNIKNGLSGAIYTQLSDVEDETNGILSYDRYICKLDSQKIKALNTELYFEFKKETKSN